MEITKKNESVVCTFEVKGIVKTVSDTIALKDEISSVLQGDAQKKIIVDFIDTFVIPSALIGALQKFILKDNAKLSVIAREEQLYELLDNLDLIGQFHVTRK